MRIGFIIPTDMESGNLPAESAHVICAGYGAGKAAACAAAAELIYEKHCDTILIWGLAGGLAPGVQVGDILIGTQVAYKDYNIYPLANSTGVGYVQGFAEDLWHPLDAQLSNALFEAVRQVFPESNVIRGGICTGDQFVLHTGMDQYNRIEQKALAVDMESAAVAHFCYNLHKKIRFGVIRVISDNANHSADMDFTTFLQAFADMNGSLPRLRDLLESTEKADLPQTEEDLWQIIKDRTLFEEYAHKLFDLFHRIDAKESFNKIAGIEARGCFLAQELAGMLGMPFVPVRKEKDSPAFVIRENMLSPEDNVLLVDDLICSGNTAVHAARAVRSTGANCSAILVLNKLESGSVDAEKVLADAALSCYQL